MSYDQALEHLRQQPVEPPSFTDVERRRRWTEQRRVPSGRRRTALVATYVSVLAYVALSIRPIIDAVGLGGGTVAALWQGTGATLLPAGLLLWAARMARRSALGPQMLSRAILWSNLVVGVLIAAAFWSGMDRTLGVVIAFACATALIALGARGLHGREEDDGVFRPTRFRGLLLVALVMAFADAQTLLFSGIMQLRIGMDGWNLLGTLRYAGPTLVASGVMVVAVWGLYRLRTWALLLNLVANFVIAYAALDGFLGLSLVVGAALASTAAVQAFVPYPILAAALGDRNAGQPVLGRLATPMVMVMVGLTALLAVVGRGAGSVGWLAGPGRAFQRGLSSRTGYAGRDLRGYRFGAANLRGASFRGARLREADLRGAHGRFNSFIEADLSGATLEGASLEWALLESATLIGANLQEARLPNCRAEGADWSGADLRRAVLVGCDLEQSVLISADLRGADLRYATMSLTDAYIRGARWDGALCPDGLVADADTGCVGHEGELDALRDERARYEGFYERVEPVTLGAACTPKTAPPEVSKVVFGNALHFLGTMFVRQTDTRFVGGSFDGHHVLEWSWDEHDTPTVRLTDEHCGEFRWRRVR